MAKPAAVAPTALCDMLVKQLRATARQRRVVIAISDWQRATRSTAHWIGDVFLKKVTEANLPVAIVVIGSQPLDAPASNPRIVELGNVPLEDLAATLEKTWGYSDAEAHEKATDVLASSEGGRPTPVILYLQQLRTRECQAV